MNASHEGGMGEVIETSLTDEEAAQAEALLDAILGNTNNPQGAQETQSTPQATDILQAAMDSQGLNDSGYQVREVEKSSSQTQKEGTNCL